MKGKTKIKVEELYKNVTDVVSDCENEIKELEKESSGLREAENTLVFENIKELYSTFNKIAEHNYTTNMQNIDIQINIVVNLLSFSVALLIAFASISELSSNWTIPSLVVILSALILIKLMFDRKKLSNRLKLTYLEGMSKYAKTLLQRTTNHLDDLDVRSEPIRMRTKTIKEKLEKSREIIERNQA